MNIKKITSSIFLSILIGSMPIKIYSVDTSEKVIYVFGLVAAAIAGGVVHKCCSGGNDYTKKVVEAKKTLENYKQIYQPDLNIIQSKQPNAIYNLTQHINKTSSYDDYHNRAQQTHNALQTLRIELQTTLGQIDPKNTNLIHQTKECLDQLIPFERDIQHIAALVKEEEGFIKAHKLMPLINQQYGKSITLYERLKKHEVRKEQYKKETKQLCLDNVTQQAQQELRYIKAALKVNECCESLQEIANKLAHQTNKDGIHQQTYNAMLTMTKALKHAHKTVTRSPEYDRATEKQRLYLQEKAKIEATNNLKAEQARANALAQWKAQELQRANTIAYERNTIDKKQQKIDKAKIQQGTLFEEEKRRIHETHKAIKDALDEQIKSLKNQLKQQEARYEQMNENERIKHQAMLQEFLAIEQRVMTFFNNPPEVLNQEDLRRWRAQKLTEIYQLMHNFKRSLQ